MAQRDNITVIQTLLKKVEDLYGNRQFEVINDELDDETLKKYRNAKLYCFKGCCLIEIKQPTLSLKYFTAGIKIDTTYSKNFYNRANAYIDLKEYEKSLADFERTVKIEKRDKNAYVGIGYCLNELKNYNRALIAYNKAIIIDKNHHLPYLGKGNVYVNLKLYKKALHNYNTAIKLNESYDDAYNNRGSLFISLNKLDEGIQDYSFAIKLSPNNYAFYLNRGKAYAQQRDYTRAISDYNQAIKLNPNDVIVYYYRAHVFRAINNIDNAILDYNKILVLNPKAIDAHFHLGVCFFLNKDYRLAILCLSKARNIKSNIEERYLLLGQCYSYLKNKVKAMNYYDRAIATNNDFYRAYQLRAKLWESLGNKINAINDYTNAININSGLHDTYFYRGLIYNSEKQFDEAIADFTKVIELKPKSYGPYQNRACCYRDIGKYELAMTDINTAIRLNPKKDILYHIRGTINAKLEMKSNAIRDFNFAIKINPKNTKSMFNRAVIFTEIGKFNLAIDDYTNIVKLEPNNKAAYNNRGVLYSKYQLNNKLAEKDFIIAIKGNKSISPFRNLANILYNQNRFIELIKYSKHCINKTTDKKIPLEWHNRAHGMLGHDVAIYQLELIDLLIQIVQPLGMKARKELLFYCKNSLIYHVNRIRSFATSDIQKDTKHAHNGHQTNMVVHYTNLKVIDSILMNNDTNKEPHFHYYNTIYMNDPEEGQILLNYLSHSDDVIINAFNRGRHKEENNIYVGSFLPAKYHEDELIMWRTYGKNENNHEACGGSLIIDTAFFDTISSHMHSQRYKEVDTNTDKLLTSQTLYRVIYYDKNEKKFVGKNSIKIKKLVDELNIAIRDLFEFKKKNNDPVFHSVVDKIVFHIISEVRYFFKSSDYAFENELRVIQFRNGEDDHVLLNNSSENLPRKLYIESSKPIRQHIKKIILGPKLQNPKQWLYLDIIMKKLGFDIDVVASACKYQ